MNALVPIAVGGWTLFAAGSDHWMRDLDLAERADLARGRDIRPTIKGALEDGSLTIAGAAGDGPPVRVERTVVPIGSGASREVDEYYLSEEAALVIVTRLRTPAAVALTRDIVRAFLLVVRGELSAPELTPKVAITFLVGRAMAADNHGAAVALLNASTTVSMLDAAEPPGCLAGGVTTRADAAERDRFAEGMGWTRDEAVAVETILADADDLHEAEPLVVDDHCGECGESEPECSCDDGAEDEGARSTDAAGRSLPPAGEVSLAAWLGEMAVTGGES